ncbi:MAG: hypothetical protein WBA74_11970, partial [Cyclobacteriaceae bacterium]
MAIFKNFNKAIQHVVLQTGKKSVERAGKKCSFKDYYASQLFIALLTETNTTPGAKKFFEEFSFQKNMKSRATNYLFSHGNPAGRSSLMSGDIFWYQPDANIDEVYTCLVLSATDNGSVEEYLIFEEHNYETYLRLKKVGMPAEKIKVSFRLGMEAISLDKSVSAFYQNDQYYHSLLNARGIVNQY